LVILFAYGSFKNKKTLEDAADAHGLKLVPDTLKGYNRKKLGADDKGDSKGGYTLARDPFGSVSGYRVELTADQFHRTRKWEDNYEPRGVKLESGKRAFAYFFVKTAKDWK
jgi:hypothetical protein